ncbi:cadinol synthase [Striga asiatica]|uniref:Cadinol synthase n=1 Tax=Striga asiatica TaxID=4170 RepID=A0A5A7PB77_STRAF|nr:cadinol synthase [Striga asiatica]
MAATDMYAPPSSWPNGRPPVGFCTKSTWGDTFASSALDHQTQENYKKAIAELKEEARSMLIEAKGKTISERLALIDTLERLGVGYHFDQEIEEQLEDIFTKFDSNQQDYDLCTSARFFRILRQHRRYVSCDVFDKFVEKDNKFKESLGNDGKGLLSLYEAAHLRIRGEEILNEAVSFTVHHLKHTVQSLEPALQTQVKRALERPLQRGIPRMEARHYISSYEKDELRNEQLLKLAKLDFNYVQNIYKDELYQLTRWWDELNPHMPYARNRLIEAHLWSVSSNFEPQYSLARVIGTKFIQMLTVLDDTYDNYATVEEGEIFAEVVERWNIDEMDGLPDYMKPLYRFILKLFDQYEADAAEQGKQPFALSYAKQTVEEICRAYTQGLKYTMGGPMDSFEDFVVNSVVASIVYVSCAAAVPSLKMVSKETIEWLKSEPKIIRAAAMVCRYLDDLGSQERESQQGTLLTGLDFYVRHHGGSIQEARDKFVELAEDEWKDLNAEWIRDVKSEVPREMVEVILGYARASDVFYRHSRDGYAKSHNMTPEVDALFMEPMAF